MLELESTSHGAWPVLRRVEVARALFAVELHGIIWITWDLLKSVRVRR